MGGDVTARLAQAQRLARALRTRSMAVRAILAKYEPWGVVHDELTRSLHTLEHLWREAQAFHEPPVAQIATFLPLNQPLYSLVLFGVVPGLLAQTVFVRPPTFMWPVMRQLWACLADVLPASLVLACLPRDEFLARAVLTADVVCFTGQYANVEAIRAALPPTTLVLYNGAGINPYVLASDANLALAIPKLVEARLYNSGQDCAGPDRIWVAYDREDDVVARLGDALEGIRVGPLDRLVDCGPLYDSRTARQAAGVLRHYADRVVWRSVLAVKRRLVGPHILLHDAASYPHDAEAFAPLFHVVGYEDESQLQAYFATPQYQAYAMYVSVFGTLSAALRAEITWHSQVLDGLSILDIEDGNRPFGGYGPRSSFVALGSDVQPRPLLLSREIAQWSRKRTL